MAWVVYSFGEIEYWDQLFGAVKNVIGSSDFQTAAALFLMLGALWKILKMSEYPDGRQIIKLVSGPVILTGLLASSVDIIVRDEILNQDRLIRNVPLIVAVPSYVVTNLQRAFTNLFETAFSIPHGVRYLDLGYDTGGYAFKDLYVGFLNSYYTHSWVQFTKDCVIPSINQGRINPNELLHSSDIEPLLNNVNPAYTTLYCNLHGECQDLYCDQAWDRLKQDTQTLLNQAKDTYVAHVLTEKGIYNSMTKAIFENYFSNISDYFFNYAVGLNNYVKQMLIVNKLSYSLKASAAYYNSQDDLMIQYLAETAKPQINTMMLALGKLAGAYIPAIKKLLIALFIAITPLMFLLLYIEEIRSKVLFTYFTTLLSLTLWEPLFAILNLFISIALQNQLSACATETNPISILYFHCMTNDATTTVAIASALAWSVPTFALAIASGSSYGLVQGFSSILGKVSGGVSADAGTFEGASKIGSQFAKVETAEQLGQNASKVLASETQYYTEQQAARFLMLENHQAFAFNREILDLGADAGRIQALEKYGGFQSSYETSKYATEKQIGSTIAGETTYTNGYVAGKTKEATSIDLVSTAYNEPSKFIELTSNTRAVDIIDKLMKDLPFNISESDLRATGINLRGEGKISLSTLATLLSPFVKNMPLTTLINSALKNPNIDTATKNLLENISLKGGYDISGKSQHQISADLKRLAGILLYERLKLQHGITENGILTEEGAEDLQRLVKNLVEPYKDKTEKVFNETKGLTHNHPHRAVKEFGQEFGETMDALKNHLPNAIAAMAWAGYAASKILNGGRGREEETITPQRKPMRRRPRHMPTSEEPPIAPTPENGEIKKLSPQEVENKIPETTKERFKNISRTAPATTIATEGAETVASTTSGRVVSSILRTATRVGGAMAIFYPETTAPAVYDELFFEGTITRTIGGELKPNSVVGLEVKTDAGNYYVPAIVDNQGNIYNYAMLKAEGINYNPESGKFYDTQTYKIVSPPETAKIGNINEKEVNLFTDQIKKGYAYPATDEGATKLKNDLK